MENWKIVQAITRSAWKCCLLCCVLFANQTFAGPPPVIAVQPLSQTVLQNSTVSFTVVAVSGTTLSYKWRLNGQYISGATKSTYTINKATTDGIYSVEVINASGSVLSSDAVLHVFGPPVSNTDTYSVPEDTLLSVAAPGLLENDTDSALAILSAQLISSPRHGTVTVNSDGSFIYRPETNYNGQDTFWYRAVDMFANGNSVVVTVNVTPVNDTPVAKRDTYTLSIDTVLSVTAPGVLKNDTDVDGDLLSALLVTNVTHGTLSLGINGAFIYTPEPGFFGIDTFSYSAMDAVSTSAPRTVTLTVNNDRPLSLSLQGFSADGFALTLTGPAPATYILYATEDFSTWTAIGTNATSTGTVTFTDPDAVKIPARFYRAVVQ